MLISSCGRKTCFWYPKIVCISICSDLWCDILILMWLLWAKFYFMLLQGEFYNYSGCGNTFNCNHPVVRQFILDCLRKMHMSCLFWKSKFIQVVRTHSIASILLHVNLWLMWKSKMDKLGRVIFIGIVMFLDCNSSLEFCFGHKKKPWLKLWVN
jgi:hypothetical protein